MLFGDMFWLSLLPGLLGYHTRVGVKGLKLFDQKFCSSCFEIVNALPAEVKFPRGGGGTNDD